MKFCSIRSFSSSLAYSFSPHSHNLPRAFTVIAAALLCAGAAAQTAHFGSYETVVVPSGLRTNHNVAVDASGNVYVPDTWNHTVLKETWTGTGYSQSTIGSGWQEPWGITIDHNGVLYLTDTGLNELMKLTPSATGYTQTMIASGFNSPQGLAVDASGNVYVADGGNNQVVKETPTGNAYSGSAIITGLGDPNGVAVDSNGNLYIADTNNYRVLLETLSGGTYTQSVFSVPGLDMPFGVSVDQYNNVYVVDTYHNKILMETLTATGTYIQTAIPTSQLYYPDGVAIDIAGNVFVADSDNSRVLKETLSGVNFGAVNIGTTSSSQPMSFVFDTAGTLGSIAVLTQGASGLDFANVGGGTCTPATSYAAAAVCTVNVTFSPLYSGMRYGAVELKNTSGAVIATGFVNGSGTGPQVNFLPGVQSTIVGTGLKGSFGVAADSSGNVYIADSSNYRILKETPSANGYTASVFLVGGYGPYGIAVDGAGDLYIADYNNSRVLKAVPNGTTYVQTPIGSGLLHPYGVAVDGGGNVYIADTSNQRILKEKPSQAGYSQTVVPTSALDDPYGVAVDSSGNVYIADTWHNRALKETLSGTTYTETVIGSGLSGPGAIAVDGNGNVFIADPYNKRIVKETPSSSGYTQSTIAFSGLDLPLGVAVNGGGNVFAGDFGGNQVLGMDLTDPPSLSFATASLGTESSTQTVTLENIGNTPLTLPVPNAGFNPSVAANFVLNTGATGDCPQVNSNSLAAATLAAGAQCQMPIAFAPQASGSVSGSVVLTDNAGNASFAQQTIALNGTGTQTTPTITWAVPAAVPYGTALSASQLNATANVAGTFLYNPAPGAVLKAGTQTLSVTFTPTNTTAYTSATASVALTVNQATSTITWAAPGAVTYGTALGASQLNATSNVGGTFAYTPASGVVLNAGAQTLSVKFNPTDSIDYTAATASVALTVNQAAQTISFVPLTTPVTYGAVPIALSATGGSSGQPVTFSVSGPGALSGSSLTITGAGTVVVTASQAGNSNYTAAKPAVQSILVNQASTSTALSAATATPTQTQPDLLTATVAGSATPTGNVVFTSEGATLCTAPLASTGAASCNFTPATPGTASIYAQYLGDSNHSASSAALAITVAPLYDAAIILQIASNNLVYPGATNVNICVTPATRRSATGTAQILDGTAALATLTLGGDGCAYWYISPGLNAGTHSISATYSGDSRNPAGASSPQAVTVNPVPVTLVVVTGSGSIPYGVGYHATVTASSNAGPPLGFITYSLDGGAAVSVSLTAGNAKIAIPGPAVGSHQLVVSYGQQTNYAAATPQSMSFSVWPAPVTVSLTPSTTTGTVGTGISFTALVASTTAGAPDATGSVSFYSGSTLLSTVAVNAQGQAAYTATSLAAGTHTITATYAGSGEYSTGSATATVTLAQAVSSTSLTAVATALTLGQSAQLTAAVVGFNPTGTVVFTASSVTLCTGALTASTAACTFTPTSIGGQSVVAHYSGDSNNLASVAHISLTVAGTVDTAITLQFASTALVYPGATNITVCVASAGKAVATGTVQLLDGTAALTTLTLGGDGCVYWYISPGLNAGTHSLSAVYSGDSKNPAGVSAVTEITVSPAPVQLAAVMGNITIASGINAYMNVTASSNAGPPVGSITYSLDGGTPISVALSNGNAKIVISQPAIGSHHVVVAYGQQSNFAAASPQTVTFTVNPAP